MNKIFLIVMLLAAVCCRLNAQQRLGVDSLFRIVGDSFPRENVYLHTDKDRYMAGDTIWFKAYLFSGGTSSELSTGVHVELFNANGRVVQRKYYPVFKGGFALGELECKDSLPEGLYTLRAYTEWMSNFDPAWFYTYTFPLYAVSTTPVNVKQGSSNPQKASSPEGGGPGAHAPLKDISVQFLPEGGDAVTDVLTSVAFRATDENGLPVKVTGRIVDNLDTLVMGFQSIHDGMGAFEYTPWKGMTYTAIVETPYGQKRIALPPAREDGVVLNARLVPQGVNFVLRADTLSRYLNQSLHIVASMYGQKVFSAKTSLTADVAETSGFIPTGKFIPGILTITLFDKDETPLAERIVFIRPSDIRINASLSVDTLNTDSKGLNAWMLHFPDSARSFVSVSVTDADALTPGEDRPTILSGLLLSGDLRGHIYHPAWYFLNDADSTQQALDLVMRTHGWRRFDWAALQQGNFPAVPFNDRNFLSFKGQAFTESGKKVVSNTTLNIFLRGSDSTKKFIFTPVDSMGNFVLDNLLFFDTASAFFQVNKKGYAAKNVQLKMKPFPSFPLTADVLNGTVFPSVAEDTAFTHSGNREAELLAGLRRLQKAKELKEIIIRGHKKTPIEELDDRYASGLFTGGVSQSFDFVNDNKQAVAYMDILSFLQGRIAGVQISGAPPNVTVKYRGGTPAFFLDEMNTDIDMIESVPVADIAYVKVFQPPFVGAFGGGGNGAIAIYTRRGGDQTAEIEGLNRLKLAGYSTIRQFYAPVYDNKKDDAIPDYRITLDWAPFLFAGRGNQTIPIRFYNNDESKHFRIVAEGVDENGKLLHLEQVVGKP